MNKLGIIGYGVVGEATAKSLPFKVKHFDIYQDKCNCSFKDILKCKYVMICVPTPTMDGKCDITLVEGIVKELADNRYKGIVIIKSTVIVGTTDKLKLLYNIPIVFNPEFLKEATAIEDAKNPDCIVIGGDRNDAIKVYNDIYKETFPKVPLIITNTRTAEIVKYAKNTKLFLETIFFNEIYDICKGEQADYNTLTTILRFDKRFKHSYIDVFRDEYRGVKGKCLPKDTEAFADRYNIKLLQEALQINKKL